MSELTKTMSATEADARVDLAACFRWFARLGMHEAVANHFSASISDDGSKFLINPKWQHFSTIKASDLIVLDTNNPDETLLAKIDPTAWAIHGQIHLLRPDVKCVLHLHPIYTTAISTLKDPTIKPIDQNTARYFNRVSYDDCYQGMADSDAEGKRLAELLGAHSRLMMGNHGVLIGSHSIGVAFDDMYTIERACQVLATGYATNQDLNLIPDAMAEKTAQDWESIEDFSEAHFAETKRVLLIEEPDFAE
ncbi:class II aldolase/adducin family protein [Psychrobacter aestuarii]|nr:class II aldolase/adducin family protein [Psychrobacter aestuarii]